MTMANDGEERRLLWLRPEFDILGLTEIVCVIEFCN